MAPLWRSSWLGILSAASIALASTLASRPLRAQHARSFVIAPYLQNLQSANVIVRFELAEPAAATVELSGGSRPAQRVESSKSQRFHSVHLTGLEPDTTMSYLVRADSGVSERGTFTTPPIDPSRPLSFVLYGDSRTDAAAHAAVVRAIEATASDFLVGTGDLVESGSDRNGWLQFFSIEQRLLRDRCLLSVVGNHDLERSANHPRRTWMRYFAPHDEELGTSYYTVRRGNTRWFMLDAMQPWDGEQAAWLRGELTRSDSEATLEHRFVVTHHAPFSSGPHGPQLSFVRAGLVDELARHKVDLVLAGHDHLYERGEVRGIKYIISGGAGAPLYPAENVQPGSAKIAAVHHFVEMRVDGASVFLVARDTQQRAIERCQYRVGEPWVCDADAAPHPSRSAAPLQTPVAGVPRPPSQAHAASRCACELPGNQARWPDKSLVLWALGWIAIAVGRRRFGRP